MLNAFWKIRFFILSTTIILTTGCTPPTSLDFYNPVANDYQLQTLGDSYLDYENPNRSYEAYIPTFLNEYATNYHGTPITYKDRARSGAKIDDILQKQYYAAIQDDIADPGYELRTLIINAGANDLRGPCVSTNTTTETGEYKYYQPCEDAINFVTTKVTDFLTKIHSQEEIDQYGQPPAIVWLGRYNFPASVAHPTILPRVNERLKDICTAFDDCFYVDTSNEWTSENADLYLQSHDGADGDPWATDGAIHVNELGGQIIAGSIWQVLSNPANDLYF